MDNNNNEKITSPGAEEKPTEKREQIGIDRAELEKQLKDKMEEIRAKTKEADEAIRQGKGRFQLENPLHARDKEITELIYDFTVLTGMEYTDAMDTDPTAQQIFRITYRQALALFAKAAAKQTPDVDQQDIMEQIGMTDAVEGVQLATLFFSASTRAGRLRISKKS